MIKLQTEIMTYFRGLQKLQGLVEPDKITNEVLEKYDEPDLPAIIFAVEPSGSYEPALGERSDTVVVTIVEHYDHQDRAAKVSEILRDEMRGMMAKTITRWTAEQTNFTSEVGKPRCVVSHSREKTSEEYAVSKHENLLAYEHRFEMDWYEK